MQVLTSFLVLLFAICVIFYFKNAEFMKKRTNRFVAGITSNGHECAPIGAEMLKIGGSAVDAALATLICEGVTIPQTMGIGGGFFMTVYEKKSGNAYFLDSREVAPSAAFRDMFVKNFSQSSTGGSSIAVPGELKGYWFAHQRFGKLPWYTIFEPSIRLCNDGFLVTKHFEKYLERSKSNIEKFETLKELLINPKTKDTWKSGDKIKRPLLGETLRTIATEGVNALYKGSLTKDFVKDIRCAGGIITTKDLEKYSPVWKSPVEINLKGMKVYTSALPGSGVILGLILNILTDLLDVEAGLNSSLNWHRIVETFKFSYARRTELADPDYVEGMQKLVANLTSKSYAQHVRSKISDTKTFNDIKYYGMKYYLKEDKGTSHVSCFSENGDAVSVTSTINTDLGSKFISPSTDILLNNHMDDFSTPGLYNAYNLPPMPNNYIQPGKRPVSSMCPSIIVDCKGNVRLIIGGSGGSKITTAVSLAIVRHILFKEDIVTIIASPRLHHQLIPNVIEAEIVFEQILKDLERIGHKYKLNNPLGFETLIGLSVDKDGNVKGSYDPRRSGSISLLTASTNSKNTEKKCPFA